MVGKGFRLSRRNRLYELAEVGFTHLEGTCGTCGTVRRKLLDDFDWKQRMQTVESIELRLRCERCCGQMVERSVKPWAKDIPYRGPR